MGSVPGVFGATLKVHVRKAMFVCSGNTEHWWYIQMSGSMSFSCSKDEFCWFSRVQQTTTEIDSVEVIAGWWFGTFFIFPYIGNNHPN